MEDTARTWDLIADAWDAEVGEGTDFQKTLVFPATERLLEVDRLRGRRVLDACCGNGCFSRRLGRAGAEVVAFDGSARMVELARARTRPEHGALTYATADACDAGAVLKLGAVTLSAPAQATAAAQATAVAQSTAVATSASAFGSTVASDSAAAFDAAVCSMALMDLRAIEPLLHAVRMLLKPGGAFVWSVGHPAFHTNAATKWATQEEESGEAQQRFGLLVTRYLSPFEHPTRGLLSQPVPNALFHRPLSVLLAACFAAGFVVDGMEEPAFPADTRLRSPFSWARRPELPPVLVVRCRAA